MAPLLPLKIPEFYNSQYFGGDSGRGKYLHIEGGCGDAFPRGRWFRCLQSALFPADPKTTRLYLRWGAGRAATPRPA